MVVMVAVVMAVIMAFMVMMMLMVLMIMVMFFTVVVMMPVVVIFMIVVMVVFVIMPVVMVVIMLVAVAVMVMVLMAVPVTLLDPVHLYGNMRPGDSAALHILPLRPDARNAEGVKLLEEPLLLLFGKKLEKGGRQHISGRAHCKVKVKGPHRLFSFGWLMRFARKPAPNPLSIFTTDTPAAQEFSIDRSAESPLKEAP